MTSQKYIQSLIDDIDGILPKAEARLPWSKPGDVAAQRRVLERVRSYLVSEQSDFVATFESPPAPAIPEQREVLQQIVQAVTQEMGVIRTNLMQPLQADIEALRQQRESLVQDIRQLERKKQQLDSITHQKTNEQQIISEFSQRLINPCTESLTQQLAQILANLEVRLGNRESTEVVVPAASSQLQIERVMHPQEHLEQLQQLQVQSDRLLTNLDANQRAIFDALQRNLQGYQESLSQGLEKMHRLGVQGEMLFTALVNRLAQQLGREASTLLHSSLQRSDAARQTNEVATSQATPGTLLPTQSIQVTELNASEAAQLKPPLNPFPETQTPLQPPQSIEQLEPLPTKPASSPSSTEAQGAIPGAIAQPLVPPGETRQVPLTDTLSPTLPTQVQPTPEDSWLDNLNSDDWESIEGLDLGNLDIESDDPGIETFIQLDTDSQSSLPIVEEMITPSPSGTQQPNALSDNLNENSPRVTPLPEQTGTAKVAGLDRPNESAEPNSFSESHRQEIDELYESLFGTNSLTGQVLSDSSELRGDARLGASNQTHAPTDFQQLSNDQFSNPASVNPLSSEVEDVLFEGLTDPAADLTQPQPQTRSEEPLPQSWETLLFEDSVAELPIEASLAGEAQASSFLDHSLSNSNSASDQEDVKTIATLTDLFEEMGLSHSLPVASAESLSDTTHERSENQTSDTDPQTSWVEDSYIPASPNENLLFTDRLESEPDREIVLDQNTLKKLSEDLDSFEELDSQNSRRQQQPSSLGNDIQSQLVVPDAERSDQENLRFPRWEELLAEDWEEFNLNEEFGPASTPQSLEEIGATTNILGQEPVEFDIHEAQGATDLGQEKTLDSSTPVVPESVDLDFDPDLFSSEPLALDLENAISLQPGEFENSHSFGVMPGDSDARDEAGNSSEQSEPEQLEGQVGAQVVPDREPEVPTSDVLDINPHQELNVFEDEALMEMLWEEQLYSTTEEMITSPELEFDSDFFLQESLNSSFDDTLTSEEEALSENLHKRPFDTPQDTTSPPKTLGNQSNSVSPKMRDFKPEDTLAPDHESLK